VSTKVDGSSHFTYPYSDQHVIPFPHSWTPSTFGTQYIRNWIPKFRRNPGPPSERTRR